MAPLSFLLKNALLVCYVVTMSLPNFLKLDFAVLCCTHYPAMLFFLSQ
mgnify:CR=1 FL=1